MNHDFRMQVEKGSRNKLTPISIMGSFFRNQIVGVHYQQLFQNLWIFVMDNVSLLIFYSDIF